jgi:hypothetical protein
MNCLSQVYRQACREISMRPAENVLFLKLLRELSVNAVKAHKAWHTKEDFITLWFISAGRFPELTGSPITDWIVSQLPFKLTFEEIQLLKL